MQDLTVPFVLRGPFGKAKYELDPEFDIGKVAVEAGLRGVLDELLGGEKKGDGKKKDDPIGDLIGDFLGGKKKK